MRSFAMEYLPATRRRGLAGALERCRRAALALWVSALNATEFACVLMLRGGEAIVPSLIGAGAFLILALAGLSLLFG